MLCRFDCGVNANEGHEHAYNVIIDRVSMDVIICTSKVMPDSKTHWVYLLSASVACCLTKVSRHI